MNIKNALGFFVLGLLMHTTPVLAQSFSVNAVVIDPSVRTIWLEFMSWVVGGVGFAYLAFDGVVRVTAFAAAVIPESLFRPEPAPAGSERMGAVVRVGVTY